MTTTTEATTADKFRFLTPEEIGNMVRVFRTSQGWTQETLAELSGLQTRTIQRVEQGQPSSTDTRRAIARAFALDDLDYFTAQGNFPTEEEVLEQKAAFERELRLVDSQVVDGRELLALMQEGLGYNAICAKGAAELPRAAQDAFAIIVDFVRDCMDIFDVASRTEMLCYGDDLDKSIDDLRLAGFRLCAAFRDTKLTKDGWTTSLPCHITYLLPGPIDRPPGKVVVAKKLS